MDNINWTNLLNKLPTSLIFILIIDFLLFKDLVKLYMFQVEVIDPRSILVLIAIFTLVVFNIGIMGVFVRIRYLQEKRKLILHENPIARTSAE